MTLIRKILFIIIISAMVGCGSRKATVPEGKGRYERPPLREVSEGQLKVDGMLIDALALQESGRTEEAMEAYVRITQADPTCAAAWYEIGRHMMDRHWADSAERCLRRAVALQPENVWYLKALAQNEEQSSYVKPLPETWERIVKVQPTVLENYYELSDAYIAAGDLGKAIEALNRVERMVGVTEAVSLQKQKLWNAAGKPDKAQKEVEALSDAYPGEKRYSSILAQIYMEQKKYSKAKTYYDRILKSNPDDPYIHIQLAEYYKATGNPAAADSEMVQAFANPALSGRTKMQLLGSFYTEEEFYGARRATTFRLMDMTMKDSEDSTQYAAFYGDVLMRQEKYLEAAHQFTLALQRDSSHYELWEAALVCLNAQEETEATMANYAARAARLFPMHTLPHYLLALHCYREKRYDDALAHIDDIMKWGFSNGYLESESYALAAECNYRAGHYEKAWSLFDKRLTQFPNDIETLNNYAYYLAEQRINLEKALEMSRKTIEKEPEVANFLDTYAWILHLLKRDHEALPYMEKAVKLDPKSETLQEHLKEIKGVKGSDKE